MKRTLFLLSASLLASLTFAQNLSDAYRFSAIQNFGTSRNAGMGGSMGALGSDFFSASFNPAGIAVYPASNLNIDMSILSNKAASNYHSSAGNSKSSDFFFNSVGFVKAFQNSEQNIRFGIGVNSLANFNNYIVNEGYNGSSSMLYSFLQNANGFTADQLSPFREQLAFNTYLLDYDGAANQYKTPINAAGQDEYYSLRQSGQINETLLALALQPASDINVGFAIGFPTLSFEESVHYRESNYQDSTSLDYFSNRSYLNTEANGVNLKFGLQYKALDFLRFGIAYHSPTWYSVTESFSSQIAAFYKDSSHVSDSPIGIFDYRVTSPSRLISSMAFIFGTRGLLSVEHEYAVFSNTEFKAASDFQDLNEDISTSFGSVHRFKIGGEINFYPLQLRAGYALTSSPFEPNNNFDFDGALAQETMSFGASVNFKDWRFNLSYIQSRTGAYSVQAYSTQFNESSILVNEKSSLVNFGINYQF